MRSWWRHEQVSIAPAVFTALHHSARKVVEVPHVVLREQKTVATKGGEENETHHTAKNRMTRPPETAGEQYFTMSDDEEAPAVGMRPGPVEDLRPQGAIWRHRQKRIEQPSLDVPVLQMFEEAAFLVPVSAVDIPTAQEQGIVQGLGNAAHGRAGSQRPTAADDGRGG